MINLNKGHENLQAGNPRIKTKKELNFVLEEGFKFNIKKDKSLFKSSQLNLNSMIIL